MKIELKEITIRELTEGYEDHEENGVVGYGGRLDIRPPYQREFIYKDKQRDAVIDTVTKNFPLNVMYWAVREDGNFEVIDGQQRTISICQYVEGDFAHRMRYFHNLQIINPVFPVGFESQVSLRREAMVELNRPFFHAIYTHGHPGIPVGDSKLVPFSGDEVHLEPIFRNIFPHDHGTEIDAILLHMKEKP